MATSKSRSGRRPLLVVAGVVAGLVSFAIFRRVAGASASIELGAFLPGALLIISGSFQLFFRAAFPEQFTASDRVKRAVMSAAGLLAGYALLLKNALTIPLGALAITAMTLAALGFPKRLFDRKV
jgi:hypothetical protein